MKILVISNMYPSEEVPNYGTFVKNFCSELEKLRIDFDKIVIKKKKNKSIGFFKYLIYYLKIFFYIIFKRYDKIYVHYASHNSLPLLIINKLKKLTIYTNVHGGDVVPQTKTQKMLQKYTRKLLNISSIVVVPSLYFKEYVISNYDIKSEKIKVYPSGGVNEELFYPFSEEDKKKNIIKGLYFDESYNYIGYIGRIEKGKGWETFLDACYELKKKNRLINKKIIIIGSGRDYERFLRKIDILNLNDYIIHIRSLPQEKLPIIYNTLSVFCFPTETYESLGLVGLEAMACGVPVIASNFAAPKDYVIEGYNGYKFEMGNSKELAKKINLFFNLNKITIDQLKKNAYLTGSMFYNNNIRNDLKKLLYINN